MKVVEWINAHGGLVARRDANRAGFSDYRIRKAREAGTITTLSGGWLATQSAGAELVRAAWYGGRLACVTAAVARGLWVLGDERFHVSVAPNSKAVAERDVRLHRSIPRVPVARAVRIESVIDMLEHVAICLPFEQALAIWESAIRRGLVDPRSLNQVAWRRLASRALAAAASWLSDSGLETMVAARLRDWGIDFHQQVKLLGHNVDLLIGERLVVQIDGWEFHSSAADRSRDIRHDAKLKLAGYHVIRLSYADVVHGWAGIEAELQLAIAQHLHRAPSANW